MIKLFYLSALIVCKTFVDSTAIDDQLDNLPPPQFIFHLNQSSGVALDKRVQRRLLDDPEPELSPFFQGMGTHYSFLWVGNPPQRVSVIMDTGSHHTAFPCVGCKCGKHMDPFFDPKKSSTAKVKNCGKDNKCFFRQSYSEGSSWHAFRVDDVAWIGGERINDIKGANNFAVNFSFGCQDQETGLFRTQVVDGIMGLSASPDTFPYMLYNQKKLPTKMFGMCFRIGGGILTLGGIDQDLNNKISKDDKKPNLRGADEVVKTHSIEYAKLTKSNGWYTVRLLDVLMKPQSTSTSSSSLPINGAKSIGGPAFKYNTGKGTIVDSGTTDTYLPSSLRNNFKNTFKSVSGVDYANIAITLSPEKYEKLPIIVFRLESITKTKNRKLVDKVENTPDFIEVEVHPFSYMEPVRNKKNQYVPRIYLTEPSGTVLGANFMNGHNVIFDIERLRIGFVESDCMYEDIIKNKKNAQNQVELSRTDLLPSTSSTSILEKTNEALGWLSNMSLNHAPLLPKRKKPRQKKALTFHRASYGDIANRLTSTVTSEFSVSAGKGRNLHPLLLIKRENSSLVGKGARAVGETITTVLKGSSSPSTSLVTVMSDSLSGVEERVREQLIDVLFDSVNTWIEERDKVNITKDSENEFKMLKNTTSFLTTHFLNDDNEGEKVLMVWLLNLEGPFKSITQTQLFDMTVVLSRFFQVSTENIHIELYHTNISIKQELYNSLKIYLITNSNELLPTSIIKSSNNDKVQKELAAGYLGKIAENVSLIKKISSSTMQNLSLNRIQIYDFSNFKAEIIAVEKLLANNFNAEENNSTADELFEKLQLLKERRANQTIIVFRCLFGLFFFGIILYFLLRRQIKNHEMLETIARDYARLHGKNKRKTENKRITK